MSEFGFYSISCERIDRTRPNILRMNGQNLTKFCININIIDKMCVDIVKRHFLQFAIELRSLIHVRIWFLCNILRTNLQNGAKFCIQLIIDKIFVGIVNTCFSQICNRVTALD